MHHHLSNYTPSYPAMLLTSLKKAANSNARDVICCITKQCPITSILFASKKTVKYTYVAKSHRYWDIGQSNWTLQMFRKWLERPEYLSWPSARFRVFHARWLCWLFRPDVWYSYFISFVVMDTKQFLRSILLADMRIQVVAVWSIIRSAHIV